METVLHTLEEVYKWRKLKFKIKPKPNHPKRFEVFKLKDPTIRKEYENVIGRKFAPVRNDEDTDVNSMWENVKSAFNSTSTTILGYRETQPQKPWISEEVIKLKAIQR